MASTLEDLEKRLAAVEQELAVLRQRLEESPTPETPAERGARLLREGRLAESALRAGWAKAMEQMGIRGAAIGPERLQQIIAAEGVDPEGNEFSRGIIEMREE